MSDTVPVTVVIPFRDAQAHAPATFASVRAQTAAPAEIIIVDDGSRPEGAAFLDGAMNRFGTVGESTRCAGRAGGAARACRLLRLPVSRGPGPARNAGVAAATQPYIAFLDADDVWLPEKLEKQFALMRSWPELDASHTGAVAFLADGSEIQAASGPRALSVDNALANHVMVTPSVMMKRSSFDRLGGFDPVFRCTQDWELQIRMAEAGLNVQYLPDVLVRVRREDHGNHSSSWRCYLAGHMRILWKHRRAYRARLGWRGWVRRGTFEAYRAGFRQRGWLGRVLQIPYRMGV